MSDMRTELDRALRRSEVPACDEDPCQFCAEAIADDLARLAAAADAAHDRLTAAATYYQAASDDHLAASSALAAALIEHQGDKP